VAYPLENEQAKDAYGFESTIAKQIIQMDSYEETFKDNQEQE
jgi:hypothetical protein